VQIPQSLEERIVQRAGPESESMGQNLRGRHGLRHSLDLRPTGIHGCCVLIRGRESQGGRSDQRREKREENTFLFSHGTFCFPPSNDPPLVMTRWNW
jgi:hypothetical protein